MTSIVDILQENKCKNLAVYGKTTKKTGEIRRLEAAFNIVYLDDNKQEAVVDDLDKVQPDAVILDKQLISQQHIFSALLHYCRERNVFFCDIRGRNLVDACVKAEERASATITRQKLLNEIEKHDMISFDVFDTLLVRKCLFPQDVFEIVERRLKEQGVYIKNFKTKRIKAQEELGLSNPNIYVIYKRLQKKYKLEDEVVEKCILLEMQVETEILTVREEMLKVYGECIKNGKRVFLVTDMYIPRELLIPILKKNGICGYEELYVSCDVGKLKLQGLLETYKNQTAGDKYLHIGDHKIHDGICAGLADIDFWLLNSSYKMMLSTRFAEYFETADSLEEHIMLGMSGAEIFNSPFIKESQDGKILCDSEYSYAYSFFAPIICKFVFWIYEVIRKREVDDILFAARDGYLIKEMYSYVREKMGREAVPQGVYFYTSRKAAVMTGINNEAQINMIIDISRDMPPHKIMRERFGLAAKDILPYKEEIYGDSIHKYVWAHVDAIFARANVAKCNYFKYIGKIPLFIGKKYAFMDFVSSGTSQKSLERIVPFELHGVYAGWNGTEKKDEVGVEALFEGKTSFFMRKYKILETFITSPEPSLSHFDEKGNPVFSHQLRNEKEMLYISCMQRACKDFLTQILELIVPEVEKIRNNLVDGIFSVSDTVKISDENAVLNHLTLMDDWQKKRHAV